uniref:Uncharacterized protein n=1 Tax=Tanacetum cinerariifolium TaxID=118510 RepID=A0A6L2P014_TANCI|nr:hypothetical protein [Tanacetum cinerariifolium]
MLKKESPPVLSLVPVGLDHYTETNILERFKNLQDDYDKLAEAHAEYEVIVQKLVTARVDLEHNIKELEAELAKKDSALVYAKRISAERAEEKEKLSHEHKQSLSEPFNMAIQAGWGKALAEGRSEKDIMDALLRFEDFDKKIYHMYDKLFKMQYPYFEKIARGFRNSVAELLKFHPDPPPPGKAPAAITARVLDKPSTPSSKAPAVYLNV